MHTPLQKVLSEPPYTALVEAAPSRVVGVNSTPLPPSLFHILLPSQGQQAPVFPLRAVEYQDRRHSSQEFQSKACRQGPRSQARSGWLACYRTPSARAQKQQKAFANRTLRSSLPLLSKSRDTSHLSFPFSCPLFLVSHIFPLSYSISQFLNDVWLDFWICLFLFQTWRQCWLELEYI